MGDQQAFTVQLDQPARRKLRRLQTMIMLYFTEDGACIEQFLEKSQPYPKLRDFINNLSSWGLTFVQVVRETLGFTPPTKFPQTSQEIFTYVQELLKEQSWKEAINWISRGLELVEAYYVIPLITKHFKTQTRRQAEALFTCFSVHLVGHVDLESLAPQLEGHSPAAVSVRGPCKIILVGGIGSLSNQYQSICAEKGWELIYIEKDIRKVRRRKRADNSSIAAILIIAGTNSHPLEGAAREIAERQKIPVFYLRSRGSVHSVREMIDTVSQTLSKK